MLTFKEFLETQEQMDEGISDYLPSANSVFAFGRNLADTATGGGYKYARAAADYAVKNTMNKVGLRKKGTTFSRELDQENQKLASDDKKNPEAAAAGDFAGEVASTLIPAAPIVGTAVAGAQKAGETYQKGSKLFSLARKALGY